MQSLQYIAGKYDRTAGRPDTAWFRFGRRVKTRYTGNMNHTPATHIEHRPNRDGQLRVFIAGTRVRVQDIYVQAAIHGRTPEEIVEGLPHLTLGQVNAAMSYFFRSP
jgi:uncharacterized protein (DUF433 family)